MALNSARHVILLCLTLLLLGGCSRHPTTKTQGYIEGTYVYMATSVSGILKQRLVNRGDQVKKGQVLFILEEQPESDAYIAAMETYKQSIAARDATMANLTNAKLTYERNKTLVPKKAIQQSALDSATADYLSLTAQLAEANSKIAELSAAASEARWQKSQKTVYAPKDAMVFNTYFEEGEFTGINQAVLSLLPPDKTKVIFFANEQDLHFLKINGDVSVQCDTCKQPYTGKISYISPSAEYTPPVIYSEQTNEKLIYRVEANFTRDDAIKLHPGQPVTVTYAAYE